MFIILQTITIVILTFLFVYIIVNWSSRQETYLALLVLASLINNIGYLKEICADNIYDAIAGTQICYIGKAFIPMLVFLFVMHFCEKKIPGQLALILFLIQFSIVFCVITCTNNTLYYKRIDFYYSGLFPHLDLDHGIMYFVFMGGTFIYFLISFIVLLKRYRHGARRAEKKAIPYLFLMVFFAALGLIMFMSGLTDGYDSTALSYCIGAVLMSIAILRFNLLKTVELAKSYAADTLSDALVVVDELGDFVYANEVAKEAYNKNPLQFNGSIPNAIDIIQDSVDTGSPIHTLDRVFRASRQELKRGRDNMGSVYLLHDISDEFHYAVKLEDAVAKKTKDIETMQFAMLESLANVVELRDGVTGTHIKHTSAYVDILVHALQKDERFSDLLPDRVCTIISAAAPLHDIGKVAIPDDILLKPGHFTDEEFEIMKTHPKLGAQLLSQVMEQVPDSDFLHIAYDMALYHHEKWDGSGYPTGLGYLDIPLCARIMAIADVYEALRAKRSYKEPFSKEKSCQILIDGKGQHFDPVMVDIFIENIDAIEAVE